MIPTFMPKDPPNYTADEISYYDSVLAMGTPSQVILVSHRMYNVLRAYCEWKNDRQPITENPTLEPL